MSDLRTRILVDMAGNLEQRAQRYSGAIDRFGKKGRRSMAMLRRGTETASRGLDQLGNRYTALLTGAAGFGTARMVMNLEDRFVRLGIQAKASAEKIDHLKEKIYKTARASEIRLDPGEITGAIEEIVEKTGDLEFAEKNIRNIGLAISATGATGKDIGGIMAEFQKMGMVDPTQVLEALDILNVQGKEGAFTLQNLAALGPRVVAAYASSGRGGIQAIREMGAALQVIRQGTGSSEMAATAFEAVMRTMSDAKKIKLLEDKLGLDVWADKEKEVLRPINELMVEIIQAAKGRQTVLSRVFDAEAIRAFNAAVGEFKRDGSVGMFEKFMDMQADGVATTRDSARAAETGTRALSQLYVAWEQFADSKLTGPIRELTELLNSVDQETVDRWLSLGTGLAVGLGGLVVANKAARAGKGLWDLSRQLRGGKGGAAAGQAGLGGFGNAVPVYVVNGPASIWPGGGGAAAGGGAATQAAAGGAGLATVMAPLVAAVGTVAAAWTSQKIGKSLARAEAGMKSTENLMALRSRHMVMGGGPDSYQVKTIDRELARRYGMDQSTMSGHGQPQEMRGEMVVKVQAERGTSARVDGLRSSHDGFNLQAETEVGFASGGSW
ncbi:MAG: tail tape measure protein [Desulfobulbaceae bacterium]|nr:MAG: tail tape measure protein [Desulfobulbaceae bacterium]